MRKTLIFHPFNSWAHMAEKEGFEPSELVRVHLISNQAHSATLSLLQYPGFLTFTK